jgi:hypothetical protein
MRRTVEPQAWCWRGQVFGLPPLVRRGLVQDADAGASGALTSASRTCRRRNSVNALVLSGEVSLKTLPCHKHPATVWDWTIQHEVAVLRTVACGAHDNPGLDEHDVWGRVVKI